MTSRRSAGIYGKPYSRSPSVGVLLIRTSCTILNQILLTMVLSTLMKEFNVLASGAQWLATGFLLVNGIIIPINAWLINRFGSKRLYTTAMPTFLIGTITCSVAQGFGILLTECPIQIAGVDISMPLLWTIMLSIFPPEKRGTAVGVAGIVTGLVPALGPILSDWIIDSYIWRDFLGMVTPIVVLVLILASFLTKNVIQLSNPSINVLLVTFSTLGPGNLPYGFSSVGDKGWDSPQVYGFLTVDAIVLCLFTYQQLHLEQPFLGLCVLESKVFTAATILFGVTNMVMIGAEMALPSHIQNIRGESAFHPGLMFLPGVLVMGLMMPVTGRILDETGARCLVITGVFISTAVTLLPAFLAKVTPTVYIIVLYAIRMFGTSMVTMPVTVSGMSALPMNLLSHGAAVNNAFQQVANPVGTTVLVSVLTNVTEGGLPASDLLKAAPLAYRGQAANTTLNGYYVASLVVIIFGALGLAATFFLSKKEAMPVKKVSIMK